MKTDAVVSLEHGSGFDRGETRGLERMLRVARLAGLGVMGTLAWASWSDAQTPTFGSPIVFPTGMTPHAVAIGDFDRDGVPDLAVASAGDNTISVYLADGVGAFRLRTDWSVGTAPVSVATGDFNGDSNPDLAAANSQSASVSVLFGRGNGEFEPAIHCAVGNSPYSVAVGDLNRDGKDDLAAPSFFDNSVRVLISDGTNPCQASAGYPAGSGTASVAIGDLNRDGKPDLATANFYSNSVSILLGDGAGGFGEAHEFPAGDGATFVAIGDLNQDGKPDLAVATAYVPSVSILFGNGLGGFAAPVQVPVLAGPQSVKIDDFNRDGKPDLAVAFTTGSVVSILPGNGDGTFGPTMNCLGGGGPSDFDRLGVGDFNQDGKPDLAVVDTSANTVSLLLNTTTIAAGAEPDLSVYSLSASIAGAYISISDVERNSGAGWAGPSVVSFYFAVNPNAPAAGTLIGTRDVPGLAGGGQYSSTTTKLAIPDATPKGTYYVCAFSDSGEAVVELDETNNTRCTTTTYLIGPDLTVSTLSATKAGGALYVSDTQRNAGNRGTGAFIVTFYLSLDAAVGPGDTFLGSRSLAGLAGGGTSDSKTTRFSIPSGMAVGYYRVLAVTDSGAAVAELNEGNNTKATTGAYPVP